MILIEVVDMNIWYVLRLHRSVVECTPVKVFEPWVLLELGRTFIVTDPILWLSLQTFINEVGCFYTPSFGNLVPLYLYLLA